MNFTPSHIEILLHYHTSPGPHPRAHAPAVIKHTDDLLRLRLICRHAEQVTRQYGGKWMTTSRGTAFVRAICGTPLPVQAWMLPSQEAKQL
jgi:hypothetical protein